MGESRVHQKTLDTMRIFADTTGKAYFNNNDLAGALGNATSDGFLLHSKLCSGHQEQSPGRAQTESQGRDHDYRVRSREGFFVFQTTMDPSSSEGMDIREALSSPLDYTGLPLSVKVDAPMAAGDKRKVGFSLLRAGQCSDGGHQRQRPIENLVCGTNVRGEEVSHNSKLYNVNLNAAYLAQLQTSGIGYNDTLELPPGQYGLRVVVRDNITGKVGSVWATLRVN